ncbi:MAG TPA: RnfABCDGE type electron transport complex subunit B [Candidatus Avalokitesvara rifleensis]|uniref:RnfABCDGE type electron transport complex subunit B n=1 Tax=Candidatus Avalokitesvara rifleensis TaxID=3367620 RepID=UPI0027136A3E|nr:RnfABCDGE type electron transport complex subunit B [Candidatus Brocadiales bacterium]
MDTVIVAFIAMGFLGMFFGFGLAIATEKFHVEIDPKQAQVENALPGINCGACGYPGCGKYAEVVAKGVAAVNLCVPGGGETADVIGGIMGVKAEKMEKRVAVLMCSAKNVKDKFNYSGVKTCRAAFLTQGGQKGCEYGCLGLDDCEVVCPTEAIYLDENKLPHVIEERCIACGKCAEICPKNLYQVLPISKYVHVRCMSLDKGGVAKKKCDNPCIACIKCEKVCPFDAIHVKNNLAIIDYNKCTSCGECVKVCPTNIIRNYRDGRPVVQSWVDQFISMAIEPIKPKKAAEREEDAVASAVATETEVAPKKVVKKDAPTAVTKTEVPHKAPPSAGTV